MQGMQRALSLIFPDQFVLCPELVEAPGGLCAACWREMPFLRGLVCSTCGTSLPGRNDAGEVCCDGCLTVPRPWATGRAAIAYRGAGRRIVLALKHGDRPELAHPAARWMADAGKALLAPGTLLVPVPIHWSRLLRRRYNQSVELARTLAAITETEHVPDALVRTRRTPVQDGLGVDQRFANLMDAITPNPRREGRLKGRNICLVDDVMTSGATLSAAATACHDAGASQVSVLVLARVEKAP